MASEDIILVHASPGRVRLKASRVKGDPALAQEVQEKLRGVAGVQEVRANPLTGSILLLLDRERMQEPEVLARLAEVLQGLCPELEILELSPEIISRAGGAGSPPGETPLKGLAGTVGALNTRIAELTGGLDLRLLVPMSLLYLGVRQLFTSKKNPAPAWYDFLWFGFSTFVMLNRPWVEGRSGAAKPQTTED